MNDPGDHSGITLFEMKGDVTIDVASLESGFESGADFVGFYEANDRTFAVFKFGYK